MSNVDKTELNEQTTHTENECVDEACDTALPDKEQTNTASQESVKIECSESKKGSRKDKKEKKRSEKEMKKSLNNKKSKKAKSSESEEKLDTAESAENAKKGKGYKKAICDSGRSFIDGIFHRKNIYGISEEYSDETSFKLRMAGSVLKKRFIRMLIAVAIFAFFVGIGSFLKSFGTAKATMMLNYEQSVNGLTINETRFNASEFTSDEVLELIIENADIGNRVTVSELKKCISIQAATNKRPTNADNYYIPTSYIIKYTRPKLFIGKTTKSMMKIICDTYLQYFKEQYIMNTQILEGDYDGLEEMEYSQIGSYFKLRISAISSYLEMRNSESGNFISEKTGETFKSIKKMADNLKNYELVNYNAYIWEKGIVRDETRYVNTLRYLNETNDRLENESTNEYLIRRSVIEYYNDIMATSVLIPTVDDKDHYYMARARTGVDYLAANADYYLSVAEGLSKSIVTNNDKLNKIDGDVTVSESQQADLMVENIKNELIRIEQLAIEEDEEYNSAHAKNYITFKIEQLGVMQRIPKKRLVICSALFVLLLFYAYYTECKYFVKRGRKK